jgi:hypothetical protein
MIQTDTIDKMHSEKSLNSINININLNPLTLENKNKKRKITNNFNINKIEKEKEQEQSKTYNNIDNNYNEEDSEMLKKKEEIRKAIIFRRKKKAKLNNNNNNDEKNIEEEKEKNKEKEKENNNDKIKGKEDINLNKKYTYIIKKGNNSVAVKKCMQHRINWKELIEQKSLFYNLKWRPISSRKDFINLLKSSTENQIINHYEYHMVISNKLNLFQNIMQFCEVINYFILI